MLERDPTSFSVLTYAWVVGLSVMGGIVSFAGKCKAGVARPLNLMEFVGELVTSAFAGMVTFYLTQASAMDPLYGAVCVAISGHMGSRLLFQLEKWATSKLTLK